MTSDAVTVAVCQLAPRLGRREDNLDAAEQAVVAAAGRGARLVVLPELASSGYAFADAAEARLAAEPADGPTVTRLAALAAAHDLVVVAGFPELDEQGAVRNSAVLVDRSGVRGVYRKAHLWDREKGYFSPGDGPPLVVSTELGRIGVVICYDLEFPEWLRLAALDGAEIVCAPTNWPSEDRPAGERPVEVVRAQASASVNRIFLAVADRVGTERGVQWVGGSCVIGPDGFPRALSDGRDAPSLLLAECRLPEARRKQISAHNDVFGDRRPALYDAGGRR